MVQLADGRERVVLAVTVRPQQRVAGLVTKHGIDTNIFVSEVDPEVLQRGQFPQSAAVAAREKIRTEKSHVVSPLTPRVPATDQPHFEKTPFVADVGGGLVGERIHSDTAGRRR